jgi:hypothetical protein
VQDKAKNLNGPSVGDKSSARDELEKILHGSRASDTNPLFTRMSQLARLEENFRYSPKLPSPPLRSLTLRPG